MQVKINDWNINYEVMGKGNPVILLHGWLANLETMRPIANNLCQNFKVYLVDIVVFGKSDLPEHPLTTDDFGNFLKDFIETLETNPETKFILAYIAKSTGFIKADEFAFDSVGGVVALMVTD